MVVIGILGLLVGILAVAVIPRLTEASSKLEKKQVGDIMQAIQQIPIDQKNKQRLQSAHIKETKGYKFFEACIKNKILDTEILSKLVSLNSKTDTKAGAEWVESGEMPETSCSYTAPKAGDLLKIMGWKGAQKTIILCFNERNWNNYDDEGVLCYWSEGDTADFITAEDAQATYNIDKTTWAAPSEIIGQKKPFNNTFDK